MDRAFRLKELHLAHTGMSGEGVALLAQVLERGVVCPCITLAYVESGRVTQVAKAEPERGVKRCSPRVPPERSRRVIGLEMRVQTVEGGVQREGDEGIHSSVRYQCLTTGESSPCGGWVSQLREGDRRWRRRTVHTIVGPVSLLGYSRRVIGLGTMGQAE